MALRRITAADVLHRLADFDTVVDARSESEHADDHLPGAVNWPTLDDVQRQAIGTEYKQVSPFDARKHGAVLAMRNIAAHVERETPPLDRTWKPLVYCWRGGQRSGSLATVLDAIGFNVHVLEGGYREFRRALLVEMDSLPATLSYRVVIGRTGSAKSRLLQALQAAGAQVLNLEALACHRGSVLGPEPGRPQPSQKAFETAVWQALCSFDAARPVVAEGESRTIGRLRIPESLLVRLRASPVLQVQMALPARVAFLLQDYSHFVLDVDSFCERLSALVEVRGHEVVNGWQQRARNGDIAGVVEDLLTLHYDPIYLRSMQRNFSQFAEAQPLLLTDGDPATLEQFALSLLRQGV
ncbi:MAG: tRNA 2-selenouridine(34) synthase MnmH [Rubrivivax sp.]